MPKRPTISRFDKRHRLAGAEISRSKAAQHTQHLVAATPSSPSSLPRDEGVASTVPNFLCNAAQSFGKEWETVCVSGLPRTTATTQNKKRKSYYEKQKKYPDLRRRRTLHPRDLCDFVAGRA